MSEATPAPPSAPPGEPPLLLLLRDLRKHFPIRGGLLGRTVATVRAVDGVSFAVRRGETLGIVGESGCGKATTARLLMRLLDLDPGTMALDGEAVGEAMPLKNYRARCRWSSRTATPR